MLNPVWRMQLVFSNTTQDFYPAYSSDSCPNFTQRVITGLQQLSSVSADLSEIDNNTFSLSGSNYIAATASANITGKRRPETQHDSVPCFQQDLMPSLGVDVSKP